MSTRGRTRINSAASTSSGGGTASNGRRSARGRRHARKKQSSKKHDAFLYPRTQDLLLSVVAGGDTAKLKAVLTRDRVQGLNNPMGKGGRTLLIQATVGDQLEIVRALFEVAEEVQGAPALDVDRVCQGLRKTPLQHAMTRAAKTRTYSIVQLLLERGASCVFPSTSTGRATTNALFDAIRLRNPRLVDMLCAHDASLVFTISPQGWLPLQSACSQDNAQVVEQLLRHGADPRDKSTMGISCLHFALGKRRAGSKTPSSESGSSTSLESNHRDNSSKPTKSNASNSTHLQAIARKLRQGNAHASDLYSKAMAAGAHASSLPPGPRQRREQAQRHQGTRANAHAATGTSTACRYDDDADGVDDDDDGTGVDGVVASGTAAPPTLTTPTTSNSSNSCENPTAAPRSSTERGCKTGNAPRMREKRRKERTDAVEAAEASVQTTGPSSSVSTATRGAARNTRSERTSTTGRSRRRVRSATTPHASPSPSSSSSSTSVSSARKTPSTLGKKGRNRFRACDDILRLLAAKVLADLMRATALRNHFLKTKTAATTIQRNVRRVQAQRAAQQALAFERQYKCHRATVHDAVLSRAREVLNASRYTSSDITTSSTAAVDSRNVEAHVADGAAVGLLRRLICRACGDPRTANDDDVPVLDKDRLAHLLQVPLQRVQDELLSDADSASSSAADAEPSSPLSPAVELQRVMQQQLSSGQTHMNMAHLVTTVLPRAALHLCDDVVKMTLAGKETQLSDTETPQQRETRAWLPSCFRYGTAHSTHLPQWVLSSTLRAMREASASQQVKAHAESDTHLRHMMETFARVLVACEMQHTHTMLLGPPRQTTSASFEGIDVALLLVLVRCVFGYRHEYTLKPAVEKQVAKHACDLLRAGVLQRFRGQGMPKAHLQDVGSLLQQAVEVLQHKLSVGSPLELVQMEIIADIAQCADTEALFQRLPDGVVGLMVNGVTVLAKVLESGNKDAVAAYFNSIERHIQRALQDHDIKRVQCMCNTQLNRQRTAVVDAFKALARGSCSHRDAYECIKILIQYRVPLMDDVCVPLMQLARDIHKGFEETCPLQMATHTVLQKALEGRSSSSLWAAVWYINAHLEDALCSPMWQWELRRARASISSNDSSSSGRGSSLAASGEVGENGERVLPVVDALLQTDSEGSERDVRRRCLSHLQNTSPPPLFQEAVARVVSCGLTVSWGTLELKNTGSNDVVGRYAISAPGTFPMSVDSLATFLRILDACDLNDQGIELALGSFPFIVSSAAEKSIGDDHAMMEILVRYIRRMLKDGAQQEQLRRTTAEKLAEAIEKLCLSTSKRSRFYQPTANVLFDRLPFCARLHQSLPEVKDAVSEHLSCTPLLQHLKSHLSNAKLTEHEQNSVREFMRAVFLDFLKCRICLEEQSNPVALCKQSGGEHYRKIQCRHQFCKECVQQWLHHGVKSGQTAFRCPIHACRFALYPDDVRRLATEDDYKRYKTLMSQDYNSRLRTLRRDGLQDVIKASCCICPRCHVIIERAAGCDAMRCICGHSFSFHQDAARPATVLSRDGRT